MRLYAALAACLVFFAFSARAEVPRVVTDIAPVHGLVSRVMEGVGTPFLLLGAAGSPHGHAMRPSEAAALESADLLVWIGPALTPWLDRARERLAPDARSLVLLALDGTHRLPVREDPVFGDPHSHDDGHGHEGDDPHAWLDPENAVLWLAEIALTIAELDPENAARYRRNAEEGAAEIRAASREVGASLEALQDQPLLVSHDALQYFERAFGLSVAGALTLSDDQPPSARQMSELAATARDVRCVLAGPDMKPGHVAALFPENAPRLVNTDPLGSGLEKGRDFYPALLRDLGRAVSACAQP